MKDPSGRVGGGLGGAKRRHLLNRHSKRPFEESVFHSIDLIGRLKMSIDIHFRGEAFRHSPCSLSLYRYGKRSLPSPLHHTVRRRRLLAYYGKFCQDAEHVAAAFQDCGVFCVFTSLRLCFMERVDGAGPDLDWLQSATKFSFANEQLQQHPYPSAISTAFTDQSSAAL